MFGRSKQRLTAWKVEASDSETRVAFSGAISDASKLDKLIHKLSGPRIVLDLGEVSRINSYGVSEWIKMMRTLKERGAMVALERCPQVIVSQLCLISGFQGHAEVRSVQVPYVCASCNAEEDRLFQVTNAELEVVPLLEQACGECSGDLQIDDLGGYYSRLPRFLSATLKSSDGP